MKEGIRRVVRVVSVIAWASLVAGVVGCLSALPDTVMSALVIGFSVAAFVALQGLAWVIAGFSGNEKGADGLIRYPLPWPKKANTTIPQKPVSLANGRSNWKLWLIGVVMWAIGWNVVKYTSQPATPKTTEASRYFQKPENQRAFVETMGSLSDDPAFLAAMKQAKPGEAIHMGARLGERGLPMLPDYMLLQRTYIYSKLLYGSDTAMCARLVRGTTTGADYVRLMAILETLSPNDVTNWLQLSRAAMDAALKNNPESFKISAAQAEEAFRTLTLKYTAAQNKDLLSFLDNPSSLSDAATCQVGKDLYRAALSAPESKRALVARALVAN